MNQHILKRSASGIGLVTATLALAACSHGAQQTQTTAANVASAQSETAGRLDSAAETVAQFREKIPDSVAMRANCIVVIPSMVKGGLFVGGESGHGFASCQTASGWSPPAPIKITGGTFGAQVGVQSMEWLALVTSDGARRALADGNFRLGVDASVAAGPVGSGRSASADVAGGGDVLSYSHNNEGLFAGATLNGSVIKPDEDATVSLYGAPLDMHSILRGETPAPQVAGTQRFIGALNASFPSTAR